MNMPSIRCAALVLVLSGEMLLLAACATSPQGRDEAEAVLVSDNGSEPEGLAASEFEEPAADEHSAEGEVPLAVAESEPLVKATPPAVLDDLIVRSQRHDVIRDLVSEARSMLQDVELEYVFTGKGKNEVLRGRPVAFA
ncbi:MAG TPA: hypothetical protein VFR29_11710, partial [Steroidobacteraceae bacterium]|nr:hypothetical protein [Steroidobacteraceae bacterium]